MVAATYWHEYDQEHCQKQQKINRKNKKFLADNDKLIEDHFNRVLPPAQQALLENLMVQPWIDAFYLAGGTALALHLGHRQSIDFDFFSDRPFVNQQVLSNLHHVGHFDLFEETRNTVHGSLNSVKISFLYYSYPLLKPLQALRTINLADIADVAAMKLSAISGRGAKKDFVDLYFLSQRYSLSELFSIFSQKYGADMNSRYHLLKSLTYFDDAEQEPMPKMITLVDWPDVKQSIIQKVKDFRFV